MQNGEAALTFHPAPRGRGSAAGLGIANFPLVPIGEAVTPLVATFDLNTAPSSRDLPAGFLLPPTPDPTSTSPLIDLEGEPRVQSHDASRRARERERHVRDGSRTITFDLDAGVIERRNAEAERSREREQHGGQTRSNWVGDDYIFNGLGSAEPGLWIYFLLHDLWTGLVFVSLSLINGGIFQDIGLKYGRYSKGRVRQTLGTVSVREMRIDTAAWHTGSKRGNLKGIINLRIYIIHNWRPQYLRDQESINQAPIISREKPVRGGFIPNCVRNRIMIVPLARH